MTWRCPRVCILAAIAFLPATEFRSADTDNATNTATPTAGQMQGQEAGQIRDDNGLKMKLVWCPPGFLTMENVEVIMEPAGNKKDKPKADNDDDDVDSEDEPEPRKTTKTTPVNVFLSKGYWLGQFEVTQAEWKQVMQTEPWQGRRFAQHGDDFPATYISWDDATAFCRQFTDKERAAGRLPDSWQYTLPTEAQWERACRARTETRFSFGDDESQLGGYAWFRDNAWNTSEQYAHRVGRKKPNAWGLYDMHGNACEWCRDWFESKLPGGRDPEVTTKGSRSSRVIRGGGWSSSAFDCRSADHYSNSPDDRDFYLGFRVGLTFVR